MPRVALRPANSFASTRPIPISAIDMTRLIRALAAALFATCALAQAQTTWHWANPTPQGNTLRAVTWHAGQFVGVGENGTILTSVNGTDWSLQASGTVRTLASVAWHVDRFVVAGENGAILTSVDGSAWAARSSGTTASLESLADDGNVLVAVGDAGTVLTSPDAVTWTVRTSTTTDDLHAVAWSGARFVAVGGSADTFTSAAILTSPDGITWTPRDTASARCLFGLAWSGAQWVAAGSSGNVVTSPDGTAWTLGSTGNANVQRSVFWNGTRFVSVGTNGTIVTSPNGTAWTDRTSVAVTGNDLFGLAGDGSSTTAVGAHGTLLASADGSVWTAVSSEIARISPSSITWDGSQFVVADFNRNILTSPDGINWTVGTGPQAPVAITWTGNQHALTTEFGEVWTSPDAVDWTNRSAPALQYNAIAGNDTTIVAVGGRGGPAMFIATSDDGGSTWKDRSIPSATDGLQAVFWNGGQFVSVGLHGRILTSPDGATWTSRTSDTTSTLSSIAWDDHQFVVAGATAFVTSPDAVTWTPHDWGALPAATAIAWNGHHFVAVGDNGAMLFSSDGINWLQVPSLTNHGLSTVAAGGFPQVQFVAGDRFGDLLYGTDEVFSSAFEAQSGIRPSMTHAALPGSSRQ